MSPEETDTASKYSDIVRLLKGDWKSYHESY